MNQGAGGLRDARSDDRHDAVRGRSRDPRADYRQDLLPAYRHEQPRGQRGHAPEDQYQPGRQDRPPEAPSGPDDTGDGYRDAARALEALRRPPGPVWPDQPERFEFPDRELEVRSGARPAPLRPEVPEPYLSGSPGREGYGTSEPPVPPPVAEGTASQGLAPLPADDQEWPAPAPAGHLPFLPPAPTGHLSGDGGRGAHSPDPAPVRDEDSVPTSPLPVIMPGAAPPAVSTPGAAPPAVSTPGAAALPGAASIPRPLAVESPRGFFEPARPARTASVTGSVEPPPLPSTDSAPAAGSRFPVPPSDEPSHFDRRAAMPTVHQRAGMPLEDGLNSSAAVAPVWPAPTVASGSGPGGPGASPDGAARGIPEAASAKLDQIKDLYLTAEAIGEDRLDQHFDQVSQRQRDLIREFFERSRPPGGDAQ
jgi:hypothetical protein